MVIIIPAIGDRRLHIINGATLKGCADMWEGITVHGAGIHTFVEVTNSTIQDANHAIVSEDGGLFILNGAFLDRNRTHLVVNAFTGQHQGGMTNTQITCSAPLLNGGIRSDAGVILTDVDQIGLGQSVSPPNIFDNMDRAFLISNMSGINEGITLVNNHIFNSQFGADIFNSTVDFHECEFHNIALEGISAFSTGPAISPFYQIGVHENLLDGCNQNAIHLTGNFDCLIEESTILNTGNTAIFIENAGWIALPQYNNIDIINNPLIEQAQAGISIMNMPMSNVRIKDNAMIRHISETAISHTASAGAGFQAFRSAKDIIARCTTDHVFRGIQVTGHDNVFVNQNKIDTDQGNGNNHPTAINLGSIRHLDVHRNEISNGASTDGLWGIYTAMSGDTYMSCNEASETGQAFTFEGNNSFRTWQGVFNTRWVGNLIDDAWDGLALRNMGVIGPQGNGNGNGLVYDNEWSLIGNEGLMSYNSPGGASNFFVRSGIPYEPSSGFIGNASMPIFSFTSPQSVSCAPLPPNPANFPESITEGQSPLTGSEIEELDWTPYETLASSAILSSNDYLNHRYLYAALQAEPLLDSILFYSPLLDTFLDSCTIAPIGILHQVDVLISEGKYKEAWIWNNSILTSQAYELNDILVNDIWLLNKLSQGLPYTQNQLDLLMTVAEQCPAQGGPAVFRARSILLEDQLNNYTSEMQLYTFVDSCDASESDSRMGQLNSNPLTSTYLLEVYPNPAGDQLTLRYQTKGTSFIQFEVYDAMGKQVFKHELFPETGTESVNFSQIATGLYFYRWIVDGQQVKSERLVIIR